MIRNTLGSGRSRRNALPSPSDQSLDQSLDQPPLNQVSFVPGDSSLENDDGGWVAEDEFIEHSNNPAPKVDPTEYDGHSVSAALPSYDEAAVLYNTMGSDSNTPCICMHHRHQSCCSMHSSLRTPNRGLLNQPRTTSSLLVPNTSGDLAMEANDFNPEEISSLTITPVHATMRYHLSLDHLACVRRQFDSGTDVDLVQSLSCNGSYTSKECNYYDWLNDIYFLRDTFLQRQQMECRLGDEAKTAEYFVGCPHQSLCISPPEFEYKDGMLEVQTWVTNYPPRCAVHPREKWSSSQGPYAQIVVCTICHSDAECTLELFGTYLKIEYICYRDLGLGVSPTDPKWLALLTGKGNPHRQKYDLRLYARVWGTGRNMGRLGVNEVIHQTPDGSFNASDELYRQEGH
jgi:hypothetical protein